MTPMTTTTTSRKADKTDKTDRPDPDLAALTTALRRSAHIRSAPALLVIFAALCTAFVWTPLDTAQLAEETRFSRDTVTRAVRTLVRHGVLQQRPAPHGHRREVRLP